ncbi:uncharacterized protein [Miscanthus floridulus]|uniref:uncharacterized protein n=1 Tax=Miscanthus floridulus TaxID=154761 RepID=UPI003458A96C
MELIKNLKGAQRLTKFLATLSHFISCLGEQGMPLYKLLKKSDHFEWTQEAQEALTRLKDFLTTSSVLTSPLMRETLLLYTTTTPHTISIALVVEHEEEGHVLKVQWPTLLLYTTTTPHTISIALVVEHKVEGHVLKVQWLVYFISEVLSDSKARYLRIQKLLYAVLITKCKL